MAGFSLPTPRMDAGAVLSFISAEANRDLDQQRLNLTLKQVDTARLFATGREAERRQKMEYEKPGGTLRTQQGEQHRADIAATKARTAHSKAAEELALLQKALFEATSEDKKAKLKQEIAAAEAKANHFDTLRKQGKELFPSLKTQAEADAERAKQLAEQATQKTSRDNKIVADQVLGNSMTTAGGVRRTEEERRAYVNDMIQSGVLSPGVQTRLKATLEGDMSVIEYLTDEQLLKLYARQGDLAVYANLTPDEQKAESILRLTDSIYRILPYIMPEAKGSISKDALGNVVRDLGATHPELTKEFERRYSGVGPATSEEMEEALSLLFEAFRTRVGGVKTKGGDEVSLGEDPTLEQQLIEGTGLVPGGATQKQQKAWGTNIADRFYRENTPEDEQSTEGKDYTRVVFGSLLELRDEEFTVYREGRRVGYEEVDKPSTVRNPFTAPLKPMVKALMRGMGQVYRGHLTASAEMEEQASVEAMRLHPGSPEEGTSLQNRLRLNRPYREKKSKFYTGLKHPMEEILEAIVEENKVSQRLTPEVIKKITNFVRGQVRGLRMARRKGEGLWEGTNLPGFSNKLEKLPSNGKMR